MLAAIQSYFGEGAVLLMVIGACLLAIRSLRRQHRQKGSACAGGIEVPAIVGIQVKVVFPDGLVFFLGAGEGDLVSRLGQLKMAAQRHKAVLIFSRRPKAEALAGLADLGDGKQLRMYRYHWFS